MILAAFAAMLAPSIRVSADEPGVTAKTITFGQVAALTGPASSLGLDMRAGILSAFKEANDKGGVKGRLVKLDSIDDGYEPDRSVAGTQTLIDSKSYFALVGAVGTPTTKAVATLVSEHSIPFIGPFTGADFLRNPDNGQIINIRASYADEVGVILKYLRNVLKVSRVGVLYQDDGFGRAGLFSINSASEAENIKIVSQAPYIRNTVAVKRAVLEIEREKPDAVIIFGAYKPAAAFIRVSKQINFDPYFFSVSFVGSNSLGKELGSEAKGVFVTQVVPIPSNNKMRITEQYRNALASHDKNVVPGFVSLEGYLVGRAVVEALNRIKEPISREAFIKTFHDREFDLGGFPLTFSDGRNWGSKTVFLTQLDGKNSIRLIRKFDQ